MCGSNVRTCSVINSGVLINVDPLTLKRVLADQVVDEGGKKGVVGSAPTSVLANQADIANPHECRDEGICAESIPQSEDAEGRERKVESKLPEIGWPPILDPPPSVLCISIRTSIRNRAR